MRQYVRSQLQARKYPLVCPSPSCQHQLAHQDVVHLLRDWTQDLQLYEQLTAEEAIDSSLRAYCPYNDCSILLERPEGDEAAAGQDLRV